MQKIRLENGEWSFDESDPLGPDGGFGEVFRGYGAGIPVAVKRLKISSGAASFREMKIGELLHSRSHHHVVPVLDFGQDAESDRYFIVMPICERSLQQAINQDGIFTLEEAKSISNDIVLGLIEVKDIVHRDLKPGNVLYHDGQWKVADFGIAKFVEDATSLETLRNALTPAYAAPEQWNGDRPTNATDVYALGCVIFTMLTGRPPFIGSVDDIREGHLHSAPPTLVCSDARLVGLVTTMLRKSPDSRPSLERCASVLSSVQAQIISPARSAIAAAGQLVSEAAAAEEAKRKAREREYVLRVELIKEAERELSMSLEKLFEAISSETEAAQRAKSSVKLGQVELKFESLFSAALIGIQYSQPYPIAGWDCLSSGVLSLYTPHAEHGQGRQRYWFEATLVLTKPPSHSEYRWHELSFFDVRGRRPSEKMPFGLSALDEEFSVALSKTMGTCSIAYGPWAIDGEDEDVFHERWISLFAKAVSKRLAPPRHFPFDETFFQ